MGEAHCREELVVVSSHCDDAALVVERVIDGIGARVLAGALVFCSHRFASSELAAALQQALGEVPLIGCTSAGELSDRGYDEDSIVFIGFPADDFRMAVHCFDDLDRFEPDVGRHAIRALGAAVAHEDAAVGQFPNHAALFLVDGLSHREELLAMTVQEALGDTVLVGGSSGDGMLFRETGILVGGRFMTDAAVVAILSSRRPMRVFTTNHYSPGAEKMVVTAADPNARVVHEINARRAADEYMRIAGGDLGAALSGEGLDAAFFAAHPPMVRAGGAYHVRSVQAVNADGSLTFYCAIDNGIVLTVGQPVDRLSQLEDLFDRLDEEVGSIDHVIGFDCVLNRIDAENRQLSGAVSRLYSRRRVVGFNTYGEQVRAAHINQTFSGLAIGR
ncbi:FIST N-terminal domain-containing protein [Novosphingobium sp. FKTRR1]|uniref:FIST N-terminal domain-containing protein n=1 Tax=Novosphingobium sp. FKTRR1 TaxID=2879118 RepID=UPI00351D6B7D